MKYFFLLMVFCITASCTPSLPALPQAPAEFVFQHTPALRFIQSSIQECSLQNAPFPVLVNEYSYNRMNLQSADISLTYANPIDPSFPAYQIGTDEIAFIVHPSNNTSVINLTELQGILQGFIVEWSSIDTVIPTNGLSQIVVYGYPANDEFLQVIITRLNEGKGYTSKAVLTDNPRSIVEKVAADPNGFAVIPRSYLNGTVREVTLQDAGNILADIPVIAQTRSEPTSGQALMIHCLQNSLGQ